MSKKNLLQIIVAASILAFGSCKDDLSKLKDAVNLSVATPEFKTYMGVEIVDAKTGMYIAEKNVKVTLGGKNAEDVYNNLGKRSTNYTVQQGMLQFVVSPEKSSISSENPVEFVIKASCEGYADVTQRVVIAESKMNIIRLKMVNKNDLPQGVTMAKSNNLTTTSNGVVQTAAVASLDAGASTVEVPQGVTLKDASGNPINGTLSSEILFYNPSSEDALAAFPGGLDVVAQRPDGTTGDINFISAGVFSIELSAGGKEVKTIEGEGLKLTTKLDPNTMNPYTNAKVKEGDQIELWSMDSETGKWTFEKLATVKKVGADLYLQESIGHLSSWNWDWFDNSCSSGAKIKWEGDANGINVLIKTVNPISNYASQKVTYVDVNDPYNSYTQFYNVPYNRPTTFKFEDGGCADGGDYTFTPSILTINNLCENQTYTVKVTRKNNNEKLYTVNLETTVTTASSNVKIKANAWLNYRPECSKAWFYANMYNGKATIKNIVLGQKYNIYGGFGNAYGEGYLKLDELPGNMLKVTFTPTYIYNYSTGHQMAPPQEMIVQKPTNSVVNVQTDIEVPAEIAKILGM